MRIPTTLTLSGMVLTSLLAATPAQAKDDPLDPFRACSSIAEASARLACFDQALVTATRLQAQSREREVRRRVEDFGLSDIQIEERAAEQSASTGAPAAVVSDEEGNAREVQSTLREVFTDGSGHRVFLLANGHVWRETSGSSYDGILRSGWKVRVSRGGIGGFRLRFEGRSGFFKVERVQ